MPAKPKFTREEIIEAALDIVSKQGLAALTAREVGRKMGSSARPIFTMFKDMEELKAEVRKTAEKHLSIYMDEAKNYTSAFKQAGIQLIDYARKEPNLYQLIFMSERRHERFEDLFIRSIAEKDSYLEFLQEAYELSAQEAKELYEHVWIYTYGICALVSSGMCDFTSDELIKMLGEDFKGMLMYIKSGQLNTQQEIPVPLETVQ